MFSPDIVCSDAFLDMPPSTQALYYLLGMRADDDGFVNPRSAMRMLGSTEDDMRLLLAKRFLLPFQNGVVVIKHWLIPNLIRSDLYKETLYKGEKATLGLNESGAYTELREGVTPLKQVEAPKWLKIRRGELRTADVPQTVPRLGKDRLGKDSNIKVADAPAPDPVDLELATQLRDRIKENTPTFKDPNLNMWAKHVRLMRERDKRTPEQIRYLIEWSQKDPFWQANILSTSKLRDKFDTLVAQVKRKVNVETLKKSNVAFV